MNNTHFPRSRALLAYPLVAVMLAFVASCAPAYAQEAPGAYWQAEAARGQQSAPSRQTAATRLRRSRSAAIAFGAEATVTAGPYGARIHARIAVGPRGVRIGAGARVGGVHPRLTAFANEFGLKIISGFRPGARVAGSRRLSNHARGTAIDAVGGNMRAAMRAAYARGMGVGTYARCTGYSHVHFSLSAGERYHKGCGRKRRGR